MAKIYHDQEKDKQAIIDRLEAEKKQLGFEFSEKLTEIKTHNYSQALLIKNLQTDLKNQVTQLEEKNQVIQSQESKQKIMLEEYSNIQAQGNILTAKIDYLVLDLKLLKLELRQAHIKNKKNEITIARLRAIRTLEGVNNSAGVAAKKRTAQRVVVSVSSPTKNPGSGISMQNPCPQ